MSALLEDEYALETVVADAAATHRAVAVLPGGGFVVLDLELDEALQAEGWARDVVRQVQDARKAAGLHVSDTIRLALGVPVEREGYARQFVDLLKAETLAREVVVSTVEAEDSDAVTISVERL